MKSLQALRMSESGRIKFKFCVCSTLLCRMRVSIFRLSYLNSEVIQNMAWEAIEERNIKIIWAKWWQLAQGEIEENKWWMPFHLAKPLPNEHTRWWLFSSRKLSFMNDTLKNMSKFLKTTMSRAPSVYMYVCVFTLVYPQQSAKPSKPVIINLNISFPALIQCELPFNCWHNAASVCNPLLCVTGHSIPAVLYALAGIAD